MALRLIGALGTALALLIYLAFGVGIFRYGVSWHANEFPSLLAEVFVAGLWFVSTAILVLKLLQSHRRRQIQPAVGV